MITASLAVGAALWGVDLKGVFAGTKYLLCGWELPQKSLPIHLNRLFAVVTEAADKPLGDNGTQPIGQRMEVDMIIFELAKCT